MVLMTSPCFFQGEQPDGSPFPEDDIHRVLTYNRLVRQVAAEFPSKVTVQDLYSMACPGGRFTSMLDGALSAILTGSTSLKPSARGRTCWPPRSSPFGSNWVTSRRPPEAKWSWAVSRLTYPRRRQGRRDLASWYRRCLSPGQS
jgi:hypothetical protein